MPNIILKQHFVRARPEFNRDVPSGFFFTSNKHRFNFSGRFMFHEIHCARHTRNISQRLPIATALYDVCVGPGDSVRIIISYSRHAIPVEIDNVVVAQVQ
jgi:hypothetical protein